MPGRTPGLRVDLEEDIMGGAAGRLAILGLMVSLPLEAQESGRPVPDRRLKEAFQERLGSWTCLGKLENPRAPGTFVATRAEITITRRADGFVYAGTYRMEKNAVEPAGAVAELVWGWDGGRARLIEVGFDNEGSSWQGTSEGMKDGTIVWTEEGNSDGRTSRTRTTVTRRSAQEIHVVNETNESDTWRKTAEEVCRPRSQSATGH